MKFSPRDWLTRLFWENIYYKLLAAALVAVLFIWVRGDREAELDVFAPVRVVVPEDQVLTSAAVDRVKVTLSGRWGAISTFGNRSLEPLLVVLDPGAIEDDVVTLTPDLVKTPSGLRAVAIQPSFFRVSLAPRLTRQVPVRVRQVGEPAVGHVLGEVAVEPALVEISGPRDQIERTRFVLTEPVDVSGRMQSFEERVQLRHDSPYVRDSLEGLVKVKVALQTLSVERALRDVPVVAVNTTLRAQVRPTQVDLVLRGPKATLDALRPDTLLALVDLDEQGRQPGTFQRQVQIRNLPPGVTIVSHQPTDFTVQLRAPSDGAP